MTYLEKNLAALRGVLPAVAARVEGAAMPEGYERVKGTDGTPTFRRVTESQGKRRWAWLGGTSMPRASAGPITSSLDAVSGGQNGLGLSMGTGYEWAAFAGGRLPRGQMVYVYEPEAGVVRMALTVCDLAGLLASCRVVVVTGSAEEAGGELSRLLNSHDGLEVPAVLHPLPTLVGERRNAFLAAGEAVVRRVVAERQALVAGLWQRIESAGRASREEAVGFLLTPRYAQERPLHGHVGGAGVRSVCIDRHDSASTALRLRLLAEVVERGARPTIESDLFRSQLGAVPAGVRVETWVPPLAGAGYWQRVPAGVAAGDRVVVHFGGHAERLEERGVARGQIEVRPLRPAHASGHRDSGHGTRNGTPSRVAMIGDLPATDAAALGIELPTHQAVFAAACELVKADYLTVHPGMAADVLRRALMRAGVDPKADDPALQEPMLRIIRDVLIPSLPLLVLTGELARQGVALTLIGEWPGVERYATTGSGVKVVSFETYDAAVWQEVAVLVQHSAEGMFSPLVWEAVAAGVAIVAGQHASDKHEGALPTLLQPEQQFANPSAANLISTIKSLLRDASRRLRLAEAAKLTRS